MDDLYVDDRAERDRRICDLRVSGRTIGDVCQMLDVTPADVNRALDKAAQAALTPQARVRAVHIEQARLEGLEEAFLPAARAGDDKAAQVVIRASERRSVLCGLNALVHMHVDPIARAQEAGPHPTSTEQIRAAIEELRGQDARALRGPGYGDWRDDRDREEMARREREPSDE